ncbi:MAG: hypothetical protein JNK76_02240 [Planctomycetales bacterium]|nr:hypothetical protein [Planctomycetales bacterium]MBN8628116.1 hypothetical protein [Planctomycetota bacterium]
MTMTRFLTRREIWEEIDARVPSAKRVMAAVSYLGTGGAELLPLRKGDTLVVDMSLGAVRQGVTNPKEIRKLMKRGVHIFTRASLHAKVVVIDDVVISSSANVSQNARNYLDESGLLTNSQGAVASAKKYIAKLCVEPVRDRYLQECIAAYKPPKFKAARTVRQVPKGRRRAKVWFIGGLRYINAEADRPAIDRIEKEAKRELANPENCEVGWIRFCRKPKWFGDIQKDNWIIDCTRANKRSHDVGPPARVVRKSTYKNRVGKARYVLVLERPNNGECMTLPQFGRVWKNVAAAEGQVPRRSRAIMSQECGEKLLSEWTPRGRVRGGR